MVRLKSRYLLIDILYPDPKTWPTSNPSKPPNPQLAIHAPTSDTLTPGFLAKMVRETVSELYGDWGVGKLGGASAGGLNSMLHTHITPTDLPILCCTAIYGPSLTNLFLLNS
jgi:ribonuclease P/MRP protein subunit POP5